MNIKNIKEILKQLLCMFMKFLMNKLKKKKMINNNNKKRKRKMMEFLLFIKKKLVNFNILNYIIIN